MGRKPAVLITGISGNLGSRLARALTDFEVVGVERPDGHSGRFPAEVELIEADLEQGLPPLPGKFDYILCADVLEHLRAPESLLHQVQQVLAPGGRLVCSLPNSGNLYFRLVVLFGHFPRKDRGLFDRTHVQFFTLDGWTELFASAGFRIERIRPTAVPFGLVFPHLAESRAVRLAEWVSYGIACFWKRLLAYQFVVTASPMQERNEQ